MAKKTGKAMDTAERVMSRAKETEEWVNSQPKVMFMIPLGKGESAGSKHPVMINGYRTTVPKGTMIEIPRPIADILSARFSVNSSDKEIGKKAGSREALS